MTEIERLNLWLLDKGGLTIDGKQVYRLVWSDKCFENRFGTFRDFTPSGFFIREVTETRLVSKYNYIKERWIFEKWAPGSLTANRETPDALNGDYIPVYVFEDSNRNYLAPTEKVLRFLLDYMRGQIKRDEEPPRELMEAREIEREVEAMDTHPIFSTHGSLRDSVAYTRGLRGVSDFKEKNVT